MNDQIVGARPRVAVPDWSAIRSETARQALQAAVDTLDMAHKWAQLDPAEDRTRRAIIAGYARTGAETDIDELSRRTQLSREEVQDTLGRLRARDLVVLAPDGRIVGAYPFTDRATEHRVRFGGKTVTAMCAIDALGMAAMLGADTTVRLPSLSGADRNCDP